MEKQESAKFIQYMAKKLKVNSQQELETAIKNMGPEKLKAAYAEYQQSEGSDSNSSDTAEYKQGGSLEYIRCLNVLKKGGVVDCGCGSKMKKGGSIQKAFLGALLAGAKGIMAGANTAGKLAQGASTAMKVGKGIQTVGKIAQIGQQLTDAANQFMAPKPTATVTPVAATSQVPLNPQVAPALNPVTSQNPPALNAQSIPTFTPTGTQPAGTQPIKPTLQEDGGKLKKLQDLRKISKKK